MVCAIASAKSQKTIMNLLSIVCQSVVKEQTGILLKRSVSQFAMTEKHGRMAYVLQTVVKVFTGKMESAKISAQRTNFSTMKAAL